MSNQRGTMDTHLVMMGGTNEDDGAITGDVESTTWTYLSEEYLGNYPPEHQSSFISDSQHVEDGGDAS